MMKAQGLIDHAEEVFKRCLGVLKKKNADYSASDANAFRNFETVEGLNITDTKSGILVRLADKLTRVCNLMKKDPQVVEESVLDTIEDAINYLVILHARIKSEKEDEKDKA